METISKQVLATILKRYPLLAEVPKYQGKWSYDFGVVLIGFQEAYRQTGEERYYQYIKDNMDYFIQADGTIRGYSYESMNIDYVNNGKLLFLLHEKTGEEKYKHALDTLFNQLQHMPRTSEGGFWHKKIYPYQMWLDGLYMGAPFYAEYLLAFQNGEGMEDVLKQFRLCFEHTLDSQTGLLYHAWDEKREQEWADPETGLSPNFWGRSMGWYVMALADTIGLLSEGDAGREELSEQLRHCLDALHKVQDPVSHVWYQVLDKGEEKGNYLEASASSMIVYAAAKAVRLGIVGAEWVQMLEASYQGLLDEFVLYTKEGWVNLTRCCEVAGLGGAERRDGTFVYYVSEPITTNDFKGLGAFLQAGLAVEAVAAASLTSKAGE